MGRPEDIAQIIGKLDPGDQAKLKDYIAGLQGESTPAPEAAAAADAEPAAANSSPAEINADKDDEGDEIIEPPFPPAYESGDDFEKASEYKMKASDLKSEGKWDEALEMYSLAIQAAEPSALLHANRATVLLKLDRPLAAEHDCSLALAMNPDSAKALRVRGKARKALGKYEEALHDLSASQQIDYDDGVVEDLKDLEQKHKDMQGKEAQKRNEEEEKKRKRAEEIKKAQEEAKREKEEEEKQRASAGGGMPGGMGGMPGGMPGGMGGMPGMGGGAGGGGGMPSIMQLLLSDPELAAGMQNPKVMAAFQSLVSEPGGVGGLMANPSKLQELYADPDVGPFLKKLMAKLGPAMGGGMPGFPGAGAPAGGPPTAGEDDIDISDLPDLE